MIFLQHTFDHSSRHSRQNSWLQELGIAISWSLNLFKQIGQRSILFLQLFVLLLLDIDDNDDDDDDDPSLS